MGEDAREVVILIAPFAFRISMHVVLVDSKNKDLKVRSLLIKPTQNLGMESLRYPAKSEDYCLKLPDSLNLYDEEIFMFLKGGHYDIIYPKDHQCSNYLDEDLLPVQEMQAEYLMKKEVITNEPRESLCRTKSRPNEEFSKKIQRDMLRTETQRRI